MEVRRAVVQVDWKPTSTREKPRQIIIIGSLATQPRTALVEKQAELIFKQRYILIILYPLQD